MTHHISRPFDGRPGTDDFGLFLFGPNTMLRLTGTSIRAEFTNRGYESQYKAQEKIQSGVAIDREKYLKKMKELHAQFQLPEDPSPLLLEYLAAPDNPDAVVSKELAQLSSWGAYFLGYDQLESHHQHILDIEQRSYDAHQLFSHGHSQAATEALLTDPVMSAFLWPEAVSALRNMPKLTQGSQHPVQLAVALEVHLSILASLDAQLPGSTSWFQTLLPTVKQNVTAKLFQWMKGEYRTIGDWLDRPEFVELVGSGELDAATAKRWSAGRTHPSHAKIKAIVQALYANGEEVPLLARDFAARLLNLLIYHALDNQTAAQVNPGSPWQPWPALPFGYPDIESWLQARYPFWYQHYLTTSRT